MPRRQRGDAAINFMPEGYCVKCKAKKEISDGKEEIMKNGRRAIKGKCPTCGTVMFKILGGKAQPPAQPVGAGTETKTTGS
jgi:Zn finger protein HypA/HybF involved in hydrogenase expression